MRALDVYCTQVQYCTYYNGINNGMLYDDVVDERCALRARYRAARRLEINALNTYTYAYNDDNNNNNASERRDETERERWMDARTRGRVERTVVKRAAADGRRGGEGRRGLDGCGGAAG